MIMLMYDYVDVELWPTVGPSHEILPYGILDLDLLLSIHDHVDIEL